MVEFNKLMILPCNQGIYIDANVLDMPYFNDVYIDSIVIDTQDTFDNSGPSKSPLYTYTIDGDNKSIKMTVNAEELLVNNLDTTMFFIYIITKGNFAANTPCGSDVRSTMAVAVNMEPIYRRSIKLLQQAYDDCEVPRGLIDFILRYNAFKTCLKTRDFSLAIIYWKRFWSMINQSKHDKCCCYG